MLIAGVDIGNSTTEICICEYSDSGMLKFRTSAMVETTGLKGTVDNVKGIVEALQHGTEKLKIAMDDLDLIRLNEATPVIGDTAMETITETVISESTMIGHNPDTPAGEGIAVGKTVAIDKLGGVDMEEPVLTVIPKNIDYEKAAIILNTTKANVVGCILEKDEAVLVYNRLARKLPIIDEVTRIHDLPLNVPAAIEVADKSGTVRTLSNPYGIARCSVLTPMRPDR